MEKVLVIAKEHNTIIDYLKMQIDNIEFEGMVDIYDLNVRASGPLRVKTIIVLDTAFRNNKLGIDDPSEAGRILIDLLNSPLFKVEYLTFLNVLSEKTIRTTNLINFIKDSYTGTTAIEVKTKAGQFLVEDVKRAITEREKDFIQTEPDTSYVIKKKRSSNVRDIPIEHFPTDRVLVTDYYTKMEGKERAKQSLINAIGDRESGATLEVGGDIVELDGIELPPILRERKEKKCKFITVTGESKSGCSTMAMILASSASNIGKTLVVDLNYTNLGLSYIAEKTLIPTEVNIIPIPEMIERGKVSNRSSMEILQDQCLHTNQLHVLSLKLSLKEVLDAKGLSFFVENILHVVREYYSFIVFDIPLYDVDNFENIVNFSDKVIVCSPPFKNNIISTLFTLQNSKIRMLDIFTDTNLSNKNDNVILMRTNIFRKVHPNIKPMKTKDINKYTKEINNFEIKVTGIFEYKGKYNEENLIQELLISELEGEE